MTTDPQARPGSPLATGAAMLVGAVLLFSAWTKLAAPKYFVATVHEYGIFPDGLVLPLSTGVVGLELALGAMLLTGFLRRAAAWISVPLLLLFMAMLGVGIAKGMDSCGCFGEAISIDPRVELGLDVVLLGLVALVIRGGRDLAAPPALAHGVAWGSLCLGAFLFLAQGPAAAAGQDEALDITVEQLSTLRQANPPLVLEGEALVFLFSADCPHCWSYAGAVEMAATRLEGLQVVGVTFSDYQAMEDFHYNFAPSYPVHTVDKGTFDALTDMFPAAAWISGGGVREGWKGHVPSHKELSDMGGYYILPPGEAPAASEPDSAATGDSPFGGTVKTRH